MSHEKILDLLRIDVHAARDDHETAPVGQEQEAVVVQPSDVAECRPAARVVSVGRLLGVVEVAERRAVAEKYVAGLACGKLVTVRTDDVDDTQHGSADRSRLSQPLLAGKRRDAAALGAGIIFVKGRTALETGDLDAGLIWAGQIQGLIHDVPTCADLIGRIVSEAEALIGGRLAELMARTLEKAA